MPRHSELNRRQRLNARRLAKKAAMLSYKHRDEVHYSQGPNRWNGIKKNMKAYKGQYPAMTDCSASVTWWIWNGLSHYENLKGYDFKDTVNGTSWSWGWTGTMMKNGAVIPIKRRKLKIGDAIIYGDPYGPTGHTAKYVGAGMVVSHGSESGPHLIPWNYRPVTAVRRSI